MPTTRNRMIHAQLTRARPSAPVREMLAYFRKTGRFRKRDVWRVLGSPGGDQTLRAAVARALAETSGEKTGKGQGKAPSVST